MRPIFLALLILSQGCSMLQSRREMMAETCKKQPELTIYSNTDGDSDWEMGCKRSKKAVTPAKLHDTVDEEYPVIIQ